MTVAERVEWRRIVASSRRIPIGKYIYMSVDGYPLKVE
jgi:hypothetical protein